jgi:hypothetical protein
VTSTRNAPDGSYDKRLGKVETELARQGERMDGLDHRMGRLEHGQERTIAGVEELLRREAARPQPTSWRTAIVTGVALVGGIGMVAGFNWWLTSVSPAMVSLDKRVTKLDDPEIGRMLRAERRLEAIEAWRTTVLPAQARR